MFLVAVTLVRMSKESKGGRGPVERVRGWVQGGLATAICQDWPEKCDDKETTEVLGLFVLGIISCQKNHKKSRQFNLVKLVGVREEDGERRPPAQMVPISKCITTQTKYIRSEISHKITRKYLHKHKKYPHTNTDQVLSHKYRQSILGQTFHKYK